MQFAYALVAAIIISAISLIGLILSPKSWTHSREVRLLGFAAGVLLTTACIELLPEAIDHGDGNATYFALLFGIIGFFFLERVFKAFHSHRQDKPVKAAGSLIIIGDGIHNFIDGVAIAIAFQVSPPVGAITALAIAAHELPQEIADYIVLIRSGYSRKRALMLNFASALTAILGVVMVFALGNLIEPYEGILLATTVGFFLYIAAADIIPELNHNHEGNEYVLPMIAGVVLIAVLATVVPA